MKTISLKLEDDLDARLAALARRRREGRSAVVRAALRAYLDGEGRPAQESCLDRIADLVGCVKGGPADLSVNPEYMEGYGK